MVIDGRAGNILTRNLGLSAGFGGLRQNSMGFFCVYDTIFFEKKTAMVFLRNGLSAKIKILLYFKQMRSGVPVFLSNTVSLYFWSDPVGSQYL